MDEKDLLIFLTLADTGNLTRTAEKLYLSQPTLSKRLQNMEADLGAALFLRSKQGVTLTPAGNLPHFSSQIRILLKHRLLQAVSHRAEPHPEPSR